MGYLNPIMHYGIEQFFQSLCGEWGVGHHHPRSALRGLSECGEAHCRQIRHPRHHDDHSRDKRRPHPLHRQQHRWLHLYGELGQRDEAQQSFNEKKIAYFNHINAMNLRNPRMIGFGISNKQTLESAQANAAGAIIGSKFVTLLNETKDPDKALDQLQEALKK